MKRFINDASTAQGKFTKYAFRIDPLNLKGAFIRGGIRL